MCTYVTEPYRHDIYSVIPSFLSGGANIRQCDDFTVFREVPMRSTTLVSGHSWVSGFLSTLTLPSAQVTMV